MVESFEPLTVLTSSVSYTTRGGVNTCLPNLPVCVPTTLVPIRGRFHCIPEILAAIVRRGIRPTMLSYVDIEIEGKSQK